MTAPRIAIIGGGLSGLYAAVRLRQQGFPDAVLFEARDRLGGRIDSMIPSKPAGPDGFDLGPTWFWPDDQPELDHLIRALGLNAFEQFSEGDMVFERSVRERPQRFPGYASHPPSMRLIGGMTALIRALRERINPSQILLGQAVTGLRIVDARVRIDCAGPAGAKEHPIHPSFDRVLLASPPRLAATTIRFEPALPPALIQQWSATPTWMAPHAKYLALYDTPFWRDRGLSGAARSACGPLVEIHDASMPGGSAALFGFVGVPWRYRATLSPDALRAQCRAQLVRLFGAQAGCPTHEALKDWALDDFTASAADREEGGGQHPQAPVSSPMEGPWVDRLAGAGSEWSPRFAGYLAGAIDAAGRAVAGLRSG
jgi:monoamine oxidase